MPCPIPSRLASTARTVAWAAALALAGCATPTPQAWRVVPSYRVTHAGAGAGQGYLALARQYEGEGRGRQALEAWRKAALEAPDDVEILDALGVAEAGQGFHQQAVAVLRRASALAPPRAARLNNLGYALLLDGRADEARGALREALALEPHHAQARANLSRLEPAAAGPAVATALPESSPPAVGGPATGALSQQPDVPHLTSLPTVAPLSLSIAATGAPGSLTAAEAHSIPSSARPAATLHAVRIEITNGNGIPGMAAWLASWLRGGGLDNAVRLSNLPPYDRPSTVVYYRSGFAEQAREVARRIPLGAEVAPHPGDARRADIRVVIGHDARHLAGCAGPCRALVVAQSTAGNLAVR